MPGDAVSTDQVHLEAWADCGDGYTVQLRQAVLRCLWCDYTATADTRREANRYLFDETTNSRSLTATVSAGRTPHGVEAKSARSSKTSRRDPTGAGDGVPPGLRVRHQPTLDR